MLGPPVVPFYPFTIFFGEGEGSPTKIDDRKTGTSLLEDLDLGLHHFGDPPR